ncbi:lipopolysaccharide biosynthesis protein [Micromonospora sp. NPDC023966]|uniref:YveK family protein n=1 Tax=Micromonospora sp. NPDC023966 TaxID=3154699 RepID=UPI0033FE6F22
MLALLGGVGAGFLAARQEPTYRAEVQMLVTFAKEQPGAQDQPEVPGPDAGKLMQRRVKTYASMMNTPRLTRPVINSLQLPYTPAQLADRIVASSTVNTLAIDVAVADRDGGIAAAIANGLAAELQRIAGRDAAPAGLGLKAQVAVLHAASAPARPERVSWPLHATSGALGGLAIGLGIAVLRGHSQAGTPISADVKTVWAALRKRPATPGPEGSYPPAQGVVRVFMPTEKDRQAS